MGYADKGGVAVFNAFDLTVSNNGPVVGARPVSPEGKAFRARHAVPLRRPLWSAVWYVNHGCHGCKTDYTDKEKQNSSMVLM